ncbi:MAG: nicotinate phosphoribosyltransferase [Burkholderiales bacterium]|jgi:nicotinate phosphoribosyltransferase|nr:nicotinate phosphoribosyltransferase [Burkholderiales bacterium]
MIDFTGTYTDYYQLTMAQVYFLDGQKDHIAVFDYFFRKNPFEGGYTIFAGLEDLLNIIENLRFDEKDINFLQKQGFHPEFINYLKTFRFNGIIYAYKEGEVVFPNSPILSIEANMIEAQIVETLVLNILNFQSLIATKASRMRQVADHGYELVDFGLRRSQGPGGYYATRAAIIGGFNSTSNIRAGRDYNIPVVGTMAHAFVQGHDNELSAFRDFSRIWPEHCVLLVDTYDTLNSGVPNAIIVAKEMEIRGHRLKGIRLDSGDLAYFAKQARHLLDTAGLSYVKITVSNQLDEYVIKSLLEQKAPIDIFGVGTNLVVGKPDAALDGVYKLALSNNKPRIKISDTFSKVNLPYKKQVYRISDTTGAFIGADIVTLFEEQIPQIMHHPFEPLKAYTIKQHSQKELMLHKVMEKGKRLSPTLSLSEIAKYSQLRLALLPEEYKRFKNPHVYKIGLSGQLNDKRNELIRKYKNT